MGAGVDNDVVASPSTNSICCTGPEEQRVQMVMLVAPACLPLIMKAWSELNCTSATLGLPTARRVMGTGTRISRCVPNDISTTEGTRTRSAHEASNRIGNSANNTTTAPPMAVRDILSDTLCRRDPDRAPGREACHV